MQETGSSLRLHDRGFADSVSSRWDHGTDTTEGRLALLNGFDLWASGISIELPLGLQRVLAFLALMNRPVMRDHLAFKLWPDKSEDRALGNLRSSLWRLRQLELDVVEVAGPRLRIGRGLFVDFHVAVAVAERILAGEPESDRRNIQDLLTAGDLLPDWFDPWVVPQRERLRQLRLHALEALCTQSLERGETSAAVAAGVAAVAAEPRRESSQRELIKAHIAEGNMAEALRQYEGYRYSLYSELGILPSPQMEALVAPIRDRSTGAVR